MGDLNTKLGCDNTLLRNVMGKHALEDRDDNGKRFAIFYNFPLCHLQHSVST